MEPRLRRLLALVSLALFFESYDVSMLTAALKHIADDLAIPPHDLADWLSLIRLGALPAFLVTPFADRLGRRTLFLASMVGMSLGTLATAFVQTPLQFVAAQMAIRTFLVAGAAVAIVIVTEEFPAEYRGWAIGMVGALSACGHGLGAVLFAFVDSLPFGWRFLYAVGVLPLLLMPAFTRGIVETERFRRHAAHGAGTLAGWWRPILGLAADRPARAAGILAVAFLLGLGEVAAFQFTSLFAQQHHGWSPPAYSAMVIGAGAVGILGNVTAGSLGDRIGRRLVGAGFLAAFPACAWLFYGGPGATLPVAFAGLVFSQTAGAVMVRALASELFPTSQRSTASGAALLAQTLGWAGGLWLAGQGVATVADIAANTRLLALAVAASGALLLLLPETGRRELEAISAEPPAGDEPAR